MTRDGAFYLDHNATTPLLPEAESVTGRRGVVTSVIDHPAVAGPCAWLERHGWEITRNSSVHFRSFPLLHRHLALWGYVVEAEG